MKKWFVIYTKSQQELKVAQQLTDIGITNYCPTITILKYYSDRKKKVKKPLLSSYVLVHLEESQRNLVFSSPGVVRYLFFLGKPAQVREKEIHLLRDHLDGVYKDYSLTTLTKGEMYKIPQGHFSGLSGKVVESDKNKVKLELQSLGMTITLKHQAA